MVLQQLLRKRCEFKWLQIHQDAFDQIRTAFKSLPTFYTLQWPVQDKDSVIIIETDGSTGTQGSGDGQKEVRYGAISYVVKQRLKSGEERLITTYGASIRARKDMSIAELETLALAISAARLRPMVTGRKVIIRTDSSTARYIRSLKATLNSKLLRWSLVISEVYGSAEFEHISGKDNILADALSRRQYPEDQCVEKEEDEGDRIGLEDKTHYTCVIEEMQEESEEVKRMVTLIEEGQDKEEVMMKDMKEDVALHDDDIIKQYAYYNKIVNKPFIKKASYQETLQHDVTHETVNNINHITEQTEQQYYKSPDYIAMIDKDQMFTLQASRHNTSQQTGRIYSIAYNMDSKVEEVKRI